MPVRKRQLIWLHSQMPVNGSKNLINIFLWAQRALCGLTCINNTMNTAHTQQLISIFVEIWNERKEELWFPADRNQNKVMVIHGDLEDIIPTTVTFLFILVLSNTLRPRLIYPKPTKQMRWKLRMVWMLSSAVKNSQSWTLETQKSCSPSAWTQTNQVLWPVLTGLPAPQEQPSDIPGQQREGGECEEDGTQVTPLTPLRRLPFLSYLILF